MNTRTIIPYAVLAATLLAACTDNHILDPGTEIDDGLSTAIEFGAAAVGQRNQTRADGTLVNIYETWLPKTAKDASDNEVGPFVGLFGYYTGSAPWSETATADIFYNTRMTIDEPTEADGKAGSGYYNTLTYADKRFWPNDGGLMSFWAYYPWNTTDDPGDYGVALTKRNPDDEGSWGIDTGQGMGSIRFTMHPDASQQNDFLISDLVADRTKANYSLTEDGIPNRVSLRFRHMLAQVRLYAFVRGLDKVVYQTTGPAEATTYVTATQAMLDSWNDGTGTFSSPELTYAKKKYFRKADETSDGVAEGKWLEEGFVIGGVTIDAAYIAAHGELLPAVMDEYGTWVELKVGDRIPDEEQSQRWDREGGTWDVTHSRRRADITYSMSFNNIRTTAIFTPEYSNGETTFTYENGSTLGSATVDHYIMNPYWFHFDNDGQRDRLNDTYMYRYFEDTYGYMGAEAKALADEEKRKNTLADGSGMDWSAYNSGSGNALDYDFNKENENTFDGDAGKVKHYNYAPCNIIMAVPQVMDDNNVPNIMLTATGYYLKADGTKGASAVSHITINMIGQSLKWESGFIYSYAFLENDLLPGVDIVRGPESITLYFDPAQWTDQW